MSAEFVLLWFLLQQQQKMTETTKEEAKKKMVLPGIDRKIKVYITLQNRQHSSCAMECSKKRLYNCVFAEPNCVAKNTFWVEKYNWKTVDGSAKISYKIKYGV